MTAGFETHGSRATYQAGCRCLPCRSANAGYEAHRARMKAEGLALGYVDPTEARAHLASLKAKGIGHRQAARLADLSPATIRAIRDGKVDVIRPATATAILAIRPVLAHGVRVNAYRTRHLLFALLREGFSRQDLAHRLGLRRRPPALHAEAVTVRNALKVRALFARVAE